MVSIVETVFETGLELIAESAPDAVKHLLGNILAKKGTEIYYKLTGQKTDREYIELIYGKLESLTCSDKSGQAKTILETYTEEYNATLERSKDTYEAIMNLRKELREDTLRQQFRLQLKEAIGSVKSYLNGSFETITNKIDSSTRMISFQLDDVSQTLETLVGHSVEIKDGVNNVSTKVDSLISHFGVDAVVNRLDEIMQSETEEKDDCFKNAIKLPLEARLDLGMYASLMSVFEQYNFSFFQNFFESHPWFEKKSRLIKRLKKYSLSKAQINLYSIYIFGKIERLKNISTAKQQIEGQLYPKLFEEAKQRVLDSQEYKQKYAQWLKENEKWQSEYEKWQVKYNEWLVKEKEWRASNPEPSFPFMPKLPDLHDYWEEYGTHGHRSLETSKYDRDQAECLNERDRLFVKHNEEVLKHSQNLAKFQSTCPVQPLAPQQPTLKINGFDFRKSYEQNPQLKIIYQRISDISSILNLFGIFVDDNGNPLINEPVLIKKSPNSPDYDPNF